MAAVCDLEIREKTTFSKRVSLLYCKKLTYNMLLVHNETQKHYLLKMKSHQDDFEEFDIQKYSADLWERWLEHPSNAEFREVYYDDRIGEKGRALLANHVSTFTLR